MMKRPPPLPLVLLVATLAGCNLLVDVPVSEPLPTRPDAPAPLSAGELLRYSLANLGEVSPGLLYRSSRPSPGLLEFLERRCALGHVINLRRSREPEVKEFVESRGGSFTHVSMSASKPPRPDQILELIRVTHRALADGRSILLQCRAGADRTGTMVAIWRMLFQKVDDHGALEFEARLHGHQSWVHPNVFETIERFRPELFMPFVRDPALLDDPERVADVTRRYFERQPLLSGRLGSNTGPLSAGTGRADLLEGPDGPIDTIQMATYGPSPGVSTGVREPVFARAIVLDNGGFRLAIVSCDLMVMGIRLRARVLELLEARGIAVDDLLLAATHTHTGIGGYVDHWLAEFYIMGTFDESIREQLARRIADAIAAADASRRPARLGAGRAFASGLSANRRLGTTIDEEVGLIRIDDDASGEPIALIVNFTGHPVLEPSDGLISPDYPGYLARELDARFGFGLFLQGALGDVNASPSADLSVWRLEGAAQSVAAQLLESLEEAARAIETVREIELASMTAELTLPAVNPNVVPDLLFPLDWMVGSLANWPRRAPLQASRIGDCALISCSTELGVRLGRRIKRRSPAPFTFVVSHANSYAGYAVTQYGHPRGKLDPTSAMANNGSSYGRRLVEKAVDLLEEQWGERLDADSPLLSSALEARLHAEVESGAVSAQDLPRRRAELIELEESELFLDRDPTAPQTRGGRLVSDSIDDLARLDLSFLYLEDARGGQGLEARLRDVDATLRLRLPLDVRVDVAVGYRDAEWDASGDPDSDAEIKDVVVGLERPFTVWRDLDGGNALRLTPRIAVTAPTGDADVDVPFAFAPAAGVWRPSFGAAAELIWDTHRALTAEALFTTSTERWNGRRPGDLWDFTLGYRERHGAVSLSLDWVTQLRSPDSRRGGRTEADIDDTSYQMGIRPGLTVHLGEHVDLRVEGIFPLARSERGAGEGTGVVAGMTAAF